MHDIEFKESASQNNRTFGTYLNYLTELSVSQFSYKNLPETIDTRFLELCLFYKGQAVFFKDDVLGYLCLRCVPSTGFNVYGIPTNRVAESMNGFRAELTEKNSVIIYNNFLRIPTYPQALLYAKALYNMDRIIDVNINAQKTPIAITCDDKQRLTFENLLMKYDGNQPFIWGVKGLSDKPLTVLKTDAPFVADRIFALRKNYLSDVLTRLGIDNNDPKKERVIKDELAVSRGETMAARMSRLEMRRNCVEEINRMFGLNIEVEFKTDDKEDNQIDDNGNIQTEGGEE